MGIYCDDKQIYGIAWLFTSKSSSDSDSESEFFEKVYEYVSNSELKPNEVIEIKNNYRFKIYVEAITTYELYNKPFLMWVPIDTNFLNNFFNIN
jgi:hypothetical protein